MILTQTIGDAVTHRILMRWARANFVPADGFFHIFTVKADKDDSDEDAKFQKTSDLGITISGKYALIDVLPIDTAGDADADPVVPALTPGTYFWGLKSQSLTDPDDIRTTAEGQFVFKHPVGQGTETAIPVYVAQPGINYDTELLTYS